MLSRNATSNEESKNIDKVDSLDLLQLDTPLGAGLKAEKVSESFHFQTSVCTNCGFRRDGLRTTFVKSCHKCGGSLNFEEGFHLD